MTLKQSGEYKNKFEKDLYKKYINITESRYIVYIGIEDIYQRYTAVIAVKLNYFIRKTFVCALTLTYHCDNLTEKEVTKRKQVL